jgi:hypothetical protein
MNRLILTCAFIIGAGLLVGFIAFLLSLWVIKL